MSANFFICLRTDILERRANFDLPFRNRGKNVEKESNNPTMQDNPVSEDGISFESDSSSKDDYFSLANLLNKPYDPCASPKRIDEIMAACANGTEADLALIHSIDPAHINMDCIMHAIAGGNVHVVEYFINNVPRELFKEACSWATELNSLSLLRWLVSAGCIPTVRTFVNAAMHGNFEIIEYLHALNNAPFYGSVDTKYIHLDPIITSTAAACGNYNVLIWLITYGYATDKGIGLIAAHPAHANRPEHERLMALIWLYEHGVYTPTHDTEIIMGQTLGGIFDPLWPPLSSLIYNAGVNNDISILRWAIHTGFEFDLNKLHRLLITLGQKGPNEYDKYLAMTAYVAEVLEHDLAAIGRPQKYDRKQVDAGFRVVRVTKKR